MSLHLGQYTLTLAIFRSSLMAMGSTFCFSHITLGQLPNRPARYRSRMMASPSGVVMYLAWTRP